MKMTDEKTREARLARIRALMERTTANGCTEAEAQAAAEGVDRLLAQYEIDLDEVSVKSQDVVRLDIAASAHSVRFAALNIGKFTDCTVWSDPPDITFLGLELDTEVAEYLVLLFMRAIDRGTTDFTLLNSDYALQDSTGRVNMVQSFEIGMASRLGERLMHLKSSRDFNQRTGGFDLVVAKGALVKQALGVLGIHLAKSGRGGASIRDKAAYQAGYSAGDRVSINQGVGRNSTTNSGSLR
jgi:hypothetical protein